MFPSGRNVQLKWGAFKVAFVFTVLYAFQIYIHIYLERRIYLLRVRYTYYLGRTFNIYRFCLVNVLMIKFKN